MNPEEPVIRPPSSTASSESNSLTLNAEPFWGPKTLKKFIENIELETDANVDKLSSGELIIYERGRQLVDRNLTVTDAIAAREQATGQKAERGRGENEKAIYILADCEEDDDGERQSIPVIWRPMEDAN